MPKATVTDCHEKVQKNPKNWEVTVGDTHMYTLRTREKSKNFLYIEGMEMTVTDCHHEKKAVQEMEHAKKFSLFGKGLQTTDIDLHSTYIKKVQKSPKNWEM